jgi:hypothetical protein
MPHPSTFVRAVWHAQVGHTPRPRNHFLDVIPITLKIPLVRFTLLGLNCLALKEAQSARDHPDLTLLIQESSFHYVRSAAVMRHGFCAEK